MAAGQKLTAVASLLAAPGCVYALHRELARSLPAATLIDDAYLLWRLAYRFVVERRAIAYDYPTRFGKWNFNGRGARWRGCFSWWIAIRGC